MYDYILFDADNTLFDFDKAQFFGFNAVLRYYNCTFSEDIYENYEAINHDLWTQFEQGKISKDILQEKRFFDFFYRLGMSVDGAEANLIYQTELSKQSWLVPHAKEICRELFPIASLAIVTNGVGKTQSLRILNSEIGKYITFSIISENVGYAKPDVKFFEEVFRIIGCGHNRNILIVGDSIASDIQGELTQELIPVGIILKILLNHLISRLIM